MRPAGLTLQLLLELYCICLLPRLCCCLYVCPQTAVCDGDGLLDVSTDVVQLLADVIFERMHSRGCRLQLSLHCTVLCTGRITV